MDMTQEGTVLSIDFYGQKESWRGPDVTGGSSTAHTRSKGGIRRGEIAAITTI